MVGPREYSLDCTAAAVEAERFSAPATIGLSAGQQEGAKAPTG
jgi:hypothetical protein